MDVLSIRKDTVMTKDPALMNVLAARSLLSIRIEELRDRLIYETSSKADRQDASDKIHLLEGAVKFIDCFLQTD